MNSNADILKEATSGFEIDLSALVAQALQEQQAQEAAKYAEIEEIPRGKALTWNTTPEQIARINAGEREALDEFYFTNFHRLRCSAWRFVRNNPYIKAVASYEDLLQQVYFDLRTGVAKFRPFDAAICNAIFHSFRYASVGGFEGIYIYKAKELR